MVAFRAQWSAEVRSTSVSGGEKGSQFGGLG